jgi:replication factor C large subunit
MLWTEKYRPGTLDEVTGQGKAVKEVRAWMDSFRPGQAAFISGPSGTGKTLLVETIARERGLELQRMNASDKRGRDQIESFSKVARTFSLFGKGKVILIDEMDGISGRDRGAVGAIVDLLKRSRFPVFLVGNDYYLQKLAPLRKHVQHIKLTKVPSPSIGKKLKDILKSEGISASETVPASLARWASGDLRSAIQDLQTISQGRKEIADRDMEILGFRERASSVYDMLPTVMKSGSLSAARKAIWDAGISSEDMFWWVETNAHLILGPEDIPAAYELLSRADLFRNRVRANQNWRFMAYMSDLLASVSLHRKHPKHGFVPVQMPDRIMMMSRTKGSRALMKTAFGKMGKHLHCSTRVFKRDYLPYLRLMAKKDKKFSIDGVELEKEEMKTVKGG